MEKTVVVTTEIAKVENKWNIDKSLVTALDSHFEDYAVRMHELEPALKECLEMPQSEEREVLAKDLGKKFMKIRTGLATTHAEQKAAYLNVGRYIDGWKNAQLASGKVIESALKEIADYTAIQKQKLIDATEEERILLLEHYLQREQMPKDLGTMDKGLFDILLLGVKKDAENAKIAEHNRLKQVAEEKAELERLRKENAALLLKEQNERVRLAKEQAEQAEAERLENLKQIEVEAVIINGDQEKFANLISDLEVLIEKHTFNASEFKDKNLKAIFDKVHQHLHKILTACKNI